MQDLANNIKLMQSIAPAALDADTNGTGVDTQGYENVAIVVDTGVEGITLSSTNKIEFELEHSDDNSSWSAVSSSNDVTDGSVDSDGIWATFDDNAEAPAVKGIGYVGGKRYLRVVADFSGTHSNGSPCSAMIIKGFPRHNVDADSSSSA